MIRYGLREGLCREEEEEDGEPDERFASCTRVLASSNGYVRKPSTPPAMPPERREMEGGVDLCLDSGRGAMMLLGKGHATSGLGEVSGMEGRGGERRGEEDGRGRREGDGVVAGR